jgi:hypothetical protein
MARFRQTPLAGVKTISIKGRKSKVTPAEFAKPLDAGNATFRMFVDSLPRILTGNELRDLVADIVRSRKNRKPVILMMGAHVIKVGMSPLITDLLRRGVITHVAMNSAAAIHDVESAIWGHTSEDVAVNLMDGTFGMSRETGEFINGALTRGMKDSDAGYGEVLGEAIIAKGGRNKAISILATCCERDIPATVHAAIGTDIVHQQPSMDGAATGELSFRDFKVFVNSIKDLRGGGVVLNVGSAVIMPEVFLKALTVARNLGFRAKGFSTANFDMIRQYRPQMNVVDRPTQKSGRGYNFTGHHEIMFPLLAAMINLSMPVR